MKRLHSALLPTLMTAALALACSDDGSNSETETGSESETTAGDGDGDTTDGDGDGDGDMGDGDGDMGDGDGDMGDGDGDMGNNDGMSGNGEFWIDSLEASVMDYALFLPQSDLDDLPPVCSWKESHQPQSWNSQLNGDFSLPVGGVDWCDAWAFCAYHGKHLCGQIGGAPATIDDADDAMNNEWFKACTDGDDNNDYPYGVNHENGYCNNENDGGDVEPVGSFENCEGGFVGLYDMSGNVWEWTSACEVDVDVPDEDQDCRRRGGSFQSSANLSRCSVNSFRSRNYRGSNTGIRCCDNI